LVTSWSARVKVLDLFCGVGGLSWGFEKVGFKVVGGIDIWERALKVFEKVHTNAKVLLADLSKLSDKEILKEFKEVDVVIGGPPCQAFSTVGKRALEDSRAWLVKEFVRVVKVLRPEVFVFENVKGFTSFARGFLVREVLEELDRLGYNLDFEILNSVNFSVPQVRERFIIIGGLSKYILLPRGNYTRRGKVWTFGEATSDLPPLESGQKADKYCFPPKNDLQFFYRKNCKEKLELHEVPSYSEKLLKMMEYIPEGKSAHEVIEEIPKEFRPTSGYKNTYKRIRWSEPAPTITRNFSVPSSSNCIHPFQNRALTPREAARLQMFPDDYPFDGTKQDIRIMIGNAVPLFLGLGLALRIAGTYGDYSIEDRTLSSLVKIEDLLCPSLEEEAWKKRSLIRRKLENFMSLL